MSKDLFEQALAAEGITGKLADVARSIYMQESGGGKNTKTSNAGAVGGMQILPGTFNEVADKGWDISNPEHNARAGIRYLGQMFKRAGGDPALAAAGYYGGPGGLAKARQGVAVSDPRNPNAPTTLQYGQQVAARLPKESVPLASPVVAPPVQVAAAPVEMPVERPMLPVGETQDRTQVMAPLAQAMPDPMMNMNYGEGFMARAPSFSMPVIPTKGVNFRPFGRWGAKV